MRGVERGRAEEIRSAVSDRAAIASAAQAAQTLADPTRLTIAASLLAGSELCVTDLAWIVGKRQNLVSHHLRLLKNAALVASHRQGRLLVFGLTARGVTLVNTVLAPSPLALALVSETADAAAIIGGAVTTP